MKTKNLTYYQRFDGMRSFFSGPILPVIDIVAMLLLIKVFNAGMLEKSFLAVVSKSGMLFCIPLLTFFSHHSFRFNRLVFFIYIGAACTLITLMFAQHIWVFIILISLLSIITHSVPSVFSQYYSGYEKEKRAKRFVTSAILLNAGTICATYIIKKMTENETYNVYLLFLFPAVFLLGAGLVSLKLPDFSFSKKQKINVSEMIKVLRTDKVFLVINIAWFLFGSANLWLYPYRTNLLVEPEFGFAYTSGTVLLLLGILPQCIRIIALPFFAWLFDRVYFLKYRIFIISLFGLYYTFFFMGTNIIHHIIGICFFGLSIAGGGIAWTLWVTKIAPPEKVSLYMAIHTSLCGLRQLLAPILGLVALTYLGPVSCAGVSLGLLGAAIVILVYVYRHGRERFIY
jgi:MFS family permease